MRKEDIQADLTTLAFDFFYWFSRFEFALKERGYLKSARPGANAEPDWIKYTKKWHAQYLISDEATLLLALQPMKQIVLHGGGLDWQPLGLENCKSQLESVVLCLKTVRNNLFHGGKHGANGWDDQTRNRTLLIKATAVLRQLADLAGIESDYLRFY